MNVGTDGGSVWTIPGTIPSRSDTVLISSYVYAADAVQDIQLTGSPTGGTFTLTSGGDTTSSIAYNATAATVQSDLTALGSIGSGNVVVTDAPGGGWKVRFAGSMAGTWQAKVTATASLTGGTSPSVAITTISAGGDAGQAFAVTDPRGLVTRTYSDAMGRTTQTVEDFTDGEIADETNKTTGYTYNSAGTTSLTAYETGGGGETTAYVYGVTTGGGSVIDDNDIVAATEYPDPTTGEASCPGPNCGRIHCQIRAVRIRVWSRAVCRIPVNSGEALHDAPMPSAKAAIISAVEPGTDSTIVRGVRRRRESRGRGGGAGRYC